MKTFQIISLLTVDANFGLGMVIPSSLGETMPGCEKPLSAPRLEKGEWVVALPEELKNQPNIGVLVPFGVADKAVSEGWTNLIGWDDSKVERWGESAPANVNPNWVKTQNGLMARR